MKKIIAILFLIIYSSTSFALSVKAHYCDGKFAGIALSNFGGYVHCGCDHTNQAHKGCCSDTEISAKTDKHRAAQQYLPANIFSDTYGPQFLIKDKDDFGLSLTQIITQRPLSSKSVRSSIPSISILNCVFLI